MNILYKMSRWLHIQFDCRFGHHYPSQETHDIELWTPTIDPMVYHWYLAFRFICSDCGELFGDEHVQENVDIHLRDLEYNKSFLKSEYAGELKRLVKPDYAKPLREFILKMASLPEIPPPKGRTSQANCAQCQDIRLKGIHTCSKGDVRKCGSCEMYETHRHLAKDKIEQMRVVINAVQTWAPLFARQVEFGLTETPLLDAAEIELFRAINTYQAENTDSGT